MVLIPNLQTYHRMRSLKRGHWLLEILYCDVETFGDYGNHALSIDRFQVTELQNSVKFVMDSVAQTARVLAEQQNEVGRGYGRRKDTVRKIFMDKEVNLVVVQSMRKVFIYFFLTHAYRLSNDMEPVVSC